MPGRVFFDAPLDIGKDLNKSMVQAFKRGDPPRDNYRQIKI